MVYGQESLSSAAQDFQPCCRGTRPRFTEDMIIATIDDSPVVLERQVDINLRSHFMLYGQVLNQVPGEVVRKDVHHRRLSLSDHRNLVSCHC